MQRFTLSLIAYITGLGREHRPQGIDDVSASLLAGFALAEDTVTSWLDAMTQLFSPGSLTIVRSNLVRSIQLHATVDLCDAQRLTLSESRGSVLADP
jgi:hypothetical protein